MPGPGLSTPTRYLHDQFIKWGGLGFAVVSFQAFKSRQTPLIKPRNSLLPGLKHLARFWDGGKYRVLSVIREHEG